MEVPALASGDQCYSQPCYFERIPYECALHIFKFLSALDMVQAIQVCKDWHQASKDPTLDLAIRFLVTTSLNRWRFRQSIQMPPNRFQMLQKRIKCDNLLVRQTHTNYQMLASFREGNTHWGNFYDVDKKQQVKITSKEPDLFERNRSKFAAFFQNTLIKFDISNSGLYLSLNVYSIDKEGTYQLKAHICDLDDINLYACNSDYFAILTGMHANSIKIYKEDAIACASINTPTLLQQHSACPAMCFAGNQLITGLTVISSNQSTLLSQAQTSSAELLQDFDIHNLCFNHLQSIDPDTGKLMISKPQPKMIKQMAGDNNTLVVARGDFKKMIFEVWALDPFSLEDRFKIECDPFDDNALLKVEGDKIIVCSMRANMLEIFNTFDGTRIIGLCSTPCLIDVAVTENYAAVAAGSVVEVWDLNTKSKLQQIDTKEYHPEKIHFHIGDGHLNKMAYLIIALNNGEIHTWSMNLSQ